MLKNVRKELPGFEIASNISENVIQDGNELWLSQDY